MRFIPPKPVLVALLGAVLIATLSWICVALPIARPLARLSYDLPFAVRSNIATPEIRLVTMDEKAAVALGQPLNARWDRGLHAQLVRALKAAGARTILFDVVFDTPGPDPAVDADFAEAMREHGQVFLGGALRITQERGVVEEKILPPVPHLREAAAGWGLLAFRPLDPDYGVRQIFPGTEMLQSATWKVARHLNAAIPSEIETPPQERWINYYGPAGTFRNVGFDQALKPAETAPDFFKDRIVVVGGRMSLGSLDLKKDEFLTPHTRWGQPFAAGMEIHATALLNLLRGDWLTRAPQPLESRLVIAFAIAITGLLSWLRPQRALPVALACALAIAIGACWSVWHRNVWWNWLVPAAVVTPAALVWSVGANYLLEARRRAAMHRAFSLYFSKNFADQIASGKFDLTLTGKLLDATMLFTDLQGFTDLSERLKDPKEIAETLINYFNNTTKHVLNHHGTVIKYAGDSIFASWGAPEPDANQADHAVQAAWDMHQFSKFNVRGHHLITRIGVNTGSVVAGNLGADLRFDYTLTGDPVNFASRLEGLNKYFKTHVLISESTLHRMKTKFAVRSVGKIRVKGKELPIEVFELLGPSVSAYTQETMEIFARGRAAYGSRQFDTARSLMEQVRARREGSDGPADFYLTKITDLEKTTLPPEWDGVIEFGEK